MMKTDYLEPVFVEFIPRDLDTRKLYISMTYSTTVHLCASGCGNKVVLPLSPAEWQMYFDGESVSLSPSVGNWEYPCQAHYWIRKNKIDWAPQWSREQIEAGWLRDQRDLDKYLDRRVDIEKQETPSAPPRSFWDRLLDIFRRR